MEDCIAGAKAAHILVVEDDPSMRRMLVSYIEDHNMHVAAVAGRQPLLHALSVREPDLIVLDLHLGDDDGFDILREVRARSVVPVILITGHRREEVDRVIGLELGADDYLLKPFSLRELLARMRAALRRRALDRLNPSRRRERKYYFAGWQFSQRQRRLITPGGETRALTKGEFALLSAFLDAPRRVLSREHLLLATRMHEEVFDRSIDVQIVRLRRKLRTDDVGPSLIRTERGVGYAFDADVELA